MCERAGFIAFITTIRCIPLRGALSQRPLKRAARCASQIGGRRRPAAAAPPTPPTTPPITPLSLAVLPRLLALGALVEDRRRLVGRARLLLPELGLAVPALGARDYFWSCFCLFSFWVVCCGLACCVCCAVCVVSLCVVVLASVLARTSVGTHTHGAPLRCGVPREPVPAAGPAAGRAAAELAALAVA